MGASAKRLDVAAAVAAFVGPLVLYLATAAPTVTFDDAGQLIVAAVSLGVSHPPGYPLFALVGHAFTLVPAGDVAWRVNIASSFAAAAAALALFVCARALLKPIFPKESGGASVAALAAAWALAFNRTVWSQAVVTEVYSLQLLVIALALYAVLAFDRDGDPRWFYAAAFFAGLALAAHQSTALWLIPLGAYLIYRRRLGVTRLAPAILFFLLGVSVYLYLPLRAVQQPAINWGDPRNADLFAKHISRASYGGPSWARMQYFWPHLLKFIKAAAASMTPVVAAAGGAGIVISLARRRRPWGIVWLLALATGPIMAAFLTAALQPHQLREMEVWFIPFYASTALLVGRAVAEALAAGAWVLRVLAYVLIAAMATPAAVNYTWANRAGYYMGEDLGANVLRSMAFEGRHLMRGRGVTGALETLFLKSGTLARPDTLFVDMSGMIYWENAPENAANVPSYEAEVLASASRRGRAAYYAAPQPHLKALGYGFIPSGVLLLVTPKPMGVRSVPWDRLAARGVAAFEKRRDASARADIPARETALLYRVMKARDWMAKNDAASAARELRAGEALASDLSDPLAEIAGLYFELGDYKKAAELFGRAASSFPPEARGDDNFRGFYTSILADQGLAFLMLGDVDAAAAAYAASLAADPEQPNLAWTKDRDALERAARDLAARR